MYVITILTKKSVREYTKEKKILKFFTLKQFFPGEIIEIIDGNKKSPAIILKSENATNLKEEIKSGKITIKILKLSKTGKYANGKIIQKTNIAEIKQYLKYPEKIKTSKNSFLKKFFPQVRKKQSTSIKRTKSTHGPQQLKDLLSSSTINKEKKYHSKMQELVDIIRKYFGENARYGTGSFSYYIGFFKKIDLSDVYRAFGEAKQAKHKTRFEQKKLFWYKIGQLVKKNK